MMDGRVLYPPKEHVCAPNWTATDDGYLVGTALQWVPVGTIYECECGRLLAAHRP